MTTATLALGTRVRINDQFGLPNTEIDKTVKAAVEAVAGSPEAAEADRLRVVGATGTVINYLSDDVWPYEVAFDKPQLVGGCSTLVAANELDLLAPEDELGVSR